MAAEKKPRGGKRGGGGRAARSGWLGDGFPPQHGDKLTLSGTFLTTYRAEVLRNGVYTPQATVIVIAFTDDGRQYGRIHLNRGGSAPSEIPCGGTHELTYNAQLGLFEGQMLLDLLGADGSPFRTQVVYIARRSHDAFAFMLVESIGYRDVFVPDGAATDGTLDESARTVRRYPPPGNRIGLREPASAIVHGVFERVS
jgi:hypothetical protein